MDVVADSYDGRLNEDREPDEGMFHPEELVLDRSRAIEYGFPCCRTDVYEHSLPHSH